MEEMDTILEIKHMVLNYLFRVNAKDTHMNDIRNIFDDAIDELKDKINSTS